MKRRYGTHPDIPDHRDRVWTPASGRRRLPAAVDLRPHCPPVYEQKSLNSCSANAIAAAIWYEELRDDAVDPGSPSRLFLYYNERAMERKVARNVPVSLRDGYKSVTRQGICGESAWPYVVSRFATRPPASCYRAAARRRVISYHRIERDLDRMKRCLHEGHPFAMGMSVYETIESKRVAARGELPMPRRGERQLGGHAVLVVGYRDASEHFIVRNSWGRRWGDAGYFFLPYDYVMHPSLAWDFWTIRRVQDLAE